MHITCSEIAQVDMMTNIMIDPTRYTCKSQDGYTLENDAELCDRTSSTATPSLDEEKKTAAREKAARN